MDVDQDAVKDGSDGGSPEQGAKPYQSLLTPDRLEALRRLAARAPRGGAVAEVGIYKGGTLKLIAECFPEASVFGFDTFEGSPSEHWQHDEFHQPGDFSDTSYEATVTYLADNKNVRLVKGIFPSIAHGSELENLRFAFVHIDVDFYLAVKEALEWFWPRMLRGGLIVFDDYEWYACPGVARVLNEFGKPFRKSAEMQAYLVKEEMSANHEPAPTPVLLEASDGVAAVCGATIPNAVSKLRIWFDHGAGDCVQFAALLQLYKRRGYDVAVHYEQNKKAIWDVAGIPWCPLEGTPYHGWPYAAGFNEPGPADDWSGSKTGLNLNTAPLPVLGDRATLWDELCEDTSRNFEPVLTPTVCEEAERFVRDLPRPLTLVHPCGSNFGESKNLPAPTIERLYELLLDAGGSVVVLDWDNRAPLLRHGRFRHTLRDWGHLSLEQLAALMEVSDLLIGVDSGPFHFSRFARLPALGVFHGFYPSCVALPHPRHAHMTRNAESYRAVNPSRRSRWNILEYDGAQPSAEEIARHAGRMLAGPRYLPAAHAGRDVMVQQWVRDWGSKSSSLSSRADRDHTFDLLLCEMRRRFIKPAVVETGCIRAREDWNAGYSSYVFGALAAATGGVFQTVDIDAGHVEVARSEIWAGAASHADSVHWLGESGMPIDVLYLDSMDCELSEHAAHALRELRAAEMRLSANALVAIDDTVWDEGCWRGKGAEVVPYLLAKNWRLLASGYQCVLARR